MIWIGNPACPSIVIMNIAGRDTGNAHRRNSECCTEGQYTLYYFDFLVKKECWACIRQAIEMKGEPDISVQNIHF